MKYLNKEDTEKLVTLMRKGRAYRQTQVEGYLPPIDEDTMLSRIANTRKANAFLDIILEYDIWFDIVNGNLVIVDPSLTQEANNGTETTSEVHMAS